MSATLASVTRQKIEEVMTHYPTKRAALLPILHLVQEEKGYVPPELEEEIAALVEVPVVKVQEVLSFYAWFKRRALGKNHLQLCRTVSCTLRGHREILEHVMNKLGIAEGETTPDGKFTLSTVECLASCETAPMMQLNEKYVDHLTPEKIDDILAGLK